MKLNKIKLCLEASNRLRHLKGRTGLTPNILCRIGFCLSLRESGLPNADVYPEDGQEFNRYTLTGEWDSLFVALLKQRCFNDGLDIENGLEDYFRAHLNRGVLTLYQNCKDLSDLQRLLPKK